MNDTDYMNKIYASTEDTGLQVVTWYNVGTRNFYAKKAINTPDDLKGLKMRVQQSPASIKMCMHLAQLHLRCHLERYIQQFSRELLMEQRTMSLL